MKKIITLILSFALILSLSVLSFSAEDLNLSVFSEMPIIDGKANDTMWASVPEITVSAETVKKGGWALNPEAQSSSAKVKIAWVKSEEKEGFCIFADINDKTESIPVTRDSEAFESTDCLTLVLDPLNKRRMTDSDCGLRFNFIPYSAKNDELTEIEYSPSWYEGKYIFEADSKTIPVQLKSSLKKEETPEGTRITGYTFETFIPLSALTTYIGPVTSGAILRMGFGIILYDYSIDSEALEAGDVPDECRNLENIVSTVVSGRRTEQKNVGRVPRYYNPLFIDLIEKGNTDEMFETIDQAPLYQIIYILQSLKEDIYTPETWIPFKECFDKAKAFSDSPALDKDPAEEEELRLKLLEAYHNLSLDNKPAPESAKIQKLKDELRSLLDSARKYINENPDKDTGKLAELSDNALSALKKYNVSAEELQKAYDDLLAEFKTFNSENDNNNVNIFSKGITAGEIVFISLTLATIIFTVICILFCIKKTKKEKSENIFELEELNSKETQDDSRKEKEFSFASGTEEKEDEDDGEFDRFD